MFPKSFRGLRWIGGVALLLGSLTPPVRAEVLGPLDPGAEMGTVPVSYWFTGASGAGFVDTHDPSNPYTGSYDFKVGNTVASTPFTGGNYGDFRSPVFPLGNAARGAQPITFSFAYELPGPVTTGDNMLAELIFYERAGANGDGDGYVGEYDVGLGDDSGDTSMTSYALFTHGGIVAPATAEWGAVRFTANIFQAWSSGAAFFDDISVTTTASQVPEIDPSAMRGALAVCVGGLAVIERRRRRPGR